MSSMYETIMELPLFKGIGEEQLSQLLEKTSVDFLKYEDGETIAKAEEKVKSLDFILSGRVRQTYCLNNFDLCVDEILSKGAVIGALHLYGLDTNYCATSTAIGRVSMMRIEKKDYMNILSSNSIYIMNFVNYLSAAAQKGPMLFQKLKMPSITRTLQVLASTFVSRSADTVMIAGQDIEIARYCGVSIEAYQEWKTGELAHNRIIANQRGILLKSPHLSR